MSNLKIMLVGKICGQDFDWTIAPLPVDDVDAAFDAPATCSYFAHLMPVDGTLQAMIDDGEKASATFGKMLLAMAGDECLDDDRYFGSIEDDQEDIRRGL